MVDGAAAVGVPAEGVRSGSLLLASQRKREEVWRNRLLTYEEEKK